MNEYGAMVECSDRGKVKYGEKNLSQCHSVHHNINMGYTVIEFGLCAETNRVM